MLGQLQMTSGGLKSKLEISIERLRACEPPEGYFVAFSGGKDSQCVYHLCKMAGVKFDAHYSITSVDPPELVRFIKEYYPDVIFERQHDKNGKPITMWSLISEKRMPPTRFARYCCEKLKESAGKDRATVTGVRWAESLKRKENQAFITVPKAGMKVKAVLDEMGADYSETQHRTGVRLNYDDATSRRTVEFCLRTGKTLINPIIDWDEDDVWEFLNSNNIPHCCLYDEGFTRLGCIGCPLAGSEKQKRDFERWPKYKQLYLNAFRRMLKKRGEDKLPESWKTPEEVMAWWLGDQKSPWGEDEDDGQNTLF